mmetsp:Transcript_18107/g.58337  ORF Transcript_18107/g.58337 Transcript_18107/m.58337 type:complete len:438 (-) Transcript_18107:206-1519(-)
MDPLVGVVVEEEVDEGGAEQADAVEEQDHLGLVRRGRRRRQHRHREPRGGGVAKLPKGDPDGPLGARGDLCPLEDPLGDGGDGAREHEPVECDDAVVRPERDAKHARRPLAADRAARVLFERPARGGAAHVLGGDVRVELGRVSELQLSRREGGDVPHPEHARPARGRRPVLLGGLQLRREAQPAPLVKLRGEGALEGGGGGRGSHARVDDVGGEDLAAHQRDRVRPHRLDPRGVVQRRAAQLEPAGGRLSDGGGQARAEGGAGRDEGDGDGGVRVEHLGSKLDSDRAPAGDEDGGGAGEAGGSLFPRAAARGQVRLARRRLDGRCRVRRPASEQQVVKGNLRLLTVGRAEGDFGGVDGNHLAHHQLIPPPRQRPRQTTQPRRLHEETEHAGRVLKVVLEVNECDIVAVAEGALRPQAREGAANHHHRRARQQEVTA